jgi:hypothetical protein
VTPLTAPSPPCPRPNFVPQMSNKTNNHLPPNSGHLTRTKSTLLKDLESENNITSLPFPGVRDAGCDISNCIPLGSYNWVDCPTPTIVIPGTGYLSLNSPNIITTRTHLGRPRVWKEPDLPLKVLPDSGYKFVDQNAWRCHKSSLEPIFRSIEITQRTLGNSSFSLAEQKIDVVTDRNNLRKLVKMVRSVRSGAILVASKNREFRIDAQLASNGRTILLTRYNGCPGRFKIDPRSPNYGASFEDAITTAYKTVQAIHNSKSIAYAPTAYHRIVQYDMADLRFLVRYEVDAAQNNPLSSGDDLSPDILKLSLDSRGVIVEKNSTLRHIVSGALVQQDHIMELKTTKKRLKWKVHSIK